MTSGGRKTKQAQQMLMSSGGRRAKQAQQMLLSSGGRKLKQNKIQSPAMGRIMLGEENKDSLQKKKGKFSEEKLKKKGCMIF